MKQKGFTPILIILVIAILGIGGYFGYKYFKSKSLPSPIPTSTQNQNADISNWKTYTNTKYNFSFKYPQSLALESLPLGNSQNKDASASSYIILGKEIYFTVSVGENSSPPERGYTETQTIGDTTFAKISFPSGDGPSTVPFTRFEADKGSVAVIIEVRGNYPTNREQSQILSTFKFLGQSEGGLQALDRCIPKTDLGAKVCYSQKTKEDCLKYSTDCRWAVAMP